ncbi:MULTISPECIES: DUF1190 domain-containing protein [unclassified Rhizobium]|uniref:DUF1190 domain-containing protein n=1 Tax=unclassified Rhizobium TaxID=2613769 RepID=UPI000EA9B79F|nr:MULTISPECIES: DUF1190 domain-containing protein [unclassified Rhizobium]AYG66810.1 DUF1190 domain-containing protein [Rhizobium sp. CCGE531]AYG73190.1 DUF1190 domain-containing protein [Rhizobium sp. CCGE532]
MWTTAIPRLRVLRLVDLSGQRPGICGRVNAQCAGGFMKRSMSVSLLLMGTAALTACGQKEDRVQIYKDINACVAGRVFSADECRSQFAAAETERQRNAPAYETAANCEKDYGVNNCQPTTSAHQSGMGHFVPLLAGYLVGNAARTFDTKALYQPRGSSDFRTATGRSLANGMLLGNTTYAARKKDDNTQSSSSSGGGGGGGSSFWGTSSEHSARSSGAVERGGWGFRGFHLSG